MAAREACTEENAASIPLKSDAVGAARNASRLITADQEHLVVTHRRASVNWIPRKLLTWRGLLAMASLSMLCVIFLLHLPGSFWRGEGFGWTSAAAPVVVTVHRKASPVTLPKFKSVVPPADDRPRARILLTDVLFPNSVSAWRLTEVKAFMDNFDTDIMVLNRPDLLTGVRFTFDWDALKDSFDLHRYDLLIFDPRYNVFNKHNPAVPADGGPPCNGSAFNHALPGRYLLRLRKHAHLPLRVDASTYDWVHHIFLDSYLRFTADFADYPPARQSIHLYPGGGFVPSLVPRHHPPFKIDPAVLLFPTQAFSMDYVRQYLPSNPVVPVYGAAIIPPDSKIVPKAQHAALKPIFVCFTSLSDIKEKGADTYVAIAESFRRAHPADNVVFFGVGNVPPSAAIVHLAPMPQAALDAFYRDHVDIIFNLERTDRMNGWPLGTEAVAQGAVLFTTDHLNLNERNGFHFGEEVHIVVEARKEATVDRLHQYYGDRHMLHNHSLAGQQRIRELFGYKAQMMPLIGAIQDSLKNKQGA